MGSASTPLALSQASSLLSVAGQQAAKQRSTTPAEGAGKVILVGNMNAEVPSLPSRHPRRAPSPLTHSPLKLTLPLILLLSFFLSLFLFSFATKREGFWTLFILELFFSKPSAFLRQIASYFLFSLWWLSSF